MALGERPLRVKNTSPYYDGAALREKEQRTALIDTVGGRDACFSVYRLHHCSAEFSGYEEVELQTSYPPFRPPGIWKITRVRHLNRDAW